MTLSIIIVSYNTRELLASCLSAIYQNTETPFEIIVVDNHSTDGSIEKVKAAYPQVRVIESETNLGFSKANNLGARASKGELLLFLNSDTQVRLWALDRLVAFLEDHSEVGIVGPRVVYPNGRYQLSAGALPSLWQEWKDRRLYRRVRSGDEDLRERVARKFQAPREVGWVTGSCLMIRRELFEALGGFDESIFMYFEDKDLCKRAAERGSKVVYFPEAEIIHVLGGSSSEERARLQRIYRESQGTYYRKHHGWLSNLILNLYLAQKEWREHLASPRGGKFESSK